MARNSDRKLVSCKACGSVFARDNVPTEECPVCHATVTDQTQLPKLGLVKKWWEEV